MLAGQTNHRWDSEGISCWGFVRIIFECLRKVHKACIVEEWVFFKERNSYVEDFHLICLCRGILSLRLKEIFSAASIIPANVLACDFLSNQTDLIP